MALSHPRRSAPLDLVRLDDRINPGTGTFRTEGSITRFDFSVSILYQASETELTRIEQTFRRASELLAEATDGQHRFGTVTFVNNGTISHDADVHVFPTSKDGIEVANAPLQGYGKRGQYVSLFADKVFAEPNFTRSGIIVTHEFAHFLYGVGDHYAYYNPAFPATSNVPFLLSYDFDALPVDDPNLRFSIMDRPTSRGGLHPGNVAVSGNVTQREFTVPSNHNYQLVTGHNQKNFARSEWDVVREGRYPILMPAGLPTDEIFPHSIDIRRSDGHATVTLLLDRSGSIDPVRLTYEQIGARMITRYLRPSDSISVISFAEDVTIDFAMSPATPGTLSQARVAINELSPSGATNITGGLQTALTQIANQSASARTPNEVIVLFTDGTNTSDFSPLTTLPGLVGQGVSVFAIGIGSDLQELGRTDLTTVAKTTAGVPFFPAQNSELIANFFRAAMGVINYPIVGATFPKTIGGAVIENQAVTIRPGTNEAIFAMSKTFADRAVTYELRSPTGQVFTPSTVGSANGFVDGLFESIRIQNPPPGNWQLTAVVPSGEQANIVQFMVASDSGALTVTVDVTAPPTPTVPPPAGTSPTPTLVLAYPQLNGQPIVGATVTAVVTRPDGTRVTMPLTDTGTKASGDTWAGDGIYSGQFSQYSSAGNGSYQFDVTVDTSKGTPVSLPASTFPPLNPGDPLPSPQPVAAGTSSTSNAVVVTGIPDLPGGTFAGRVFDDLNNNRTFDPGEPGFQGVLVYPDFNLSGDRDNTEPFTFTDLTGALRTRAHGAGRVRHPHRAPGRGNANFSRPDRGGRRRSDSNGDRLRPR